MNGYLPIWKPAGPTSFDVVRRIRRASRVKRVGHGGTLDPAAEGVLPVLLGQGARMSEYLEECAKAYRARVLLGVRTDTLDMEGQVLERRDPSAVAREQVEALLPAFTGVILQTPPMYSALKREGQRLYELARQGIEVERAARKVTVYDIRLVEWAPPGLTLDVVCGRGTYIRSLAADLGDRLGCGAALERLARTRVGPFRAEDAVPLEEAEAAFADGRVEGMVLPLEALFAGWPCVHLDSEAARRVASGSTVNIPSTAWSLVPGVVEKPFSPPPQAGTAIAFGPEGRFLALLALEGGDVWRPRKVAAVS
jgi:tRNA pseudouridine55 synthase